MSKAALLVLEYLGSDLLRNFGDRCQIGRERGGENAVRAVREGEDGGGGGEGGYFERDCSTHA